MTIAPQNDSSSPFQYVPVPNEHVPAILAFLGERLAAQGTPDAVAEAPAGVPSAAGSVPAVDDAPPGTSADAPVDDWTDERLLDFLEMRTKSAGTVIRMLDHLVDTPGKEAALSTRELADALGERYHVLKNVPTQMGRTLGKHFDGCGAPYWGLWGSSHFDPPRSKEMYFAVTEERAEQWKRLRG